MQASTSSSAASSSGSVGRHLPNASFSRPVKQRGCARACLAQLHRPEEQRRIVCAAIANPVDTASWAAFQDVATRLPQTQQPLFPSGADDLQEQELQPETRSVGAVAGALCGNALGAVVRHEQCFKVVRMFPQGLTEFWPYDIAAQPVKKGQATGEFMLMLATAHSLLQAQCVDARVVASNLAQRCDTASRVYTPHAQYILSQLQSGAVSADSLAQLAMLPVQAAREYTEQRAGATSTASDRWDRDPWGPADHTAAVAYSVPIALAYRTSAWEVVGTAVQEACLLSHSHPIGIDGARVLAAAVHWLLQQPAPAAVGSGEAVGPQALLAYLLTVANTRDMKNKLRLLQQELFQVDRVDSWPAMYRSEQWHRLRRVLTRITYHDLATAGTEAVSVALWAFCTHWKRPHQAVCVAAAFAGSTPVTTQMVGALAGALHGDAWIPGSWWATVENWPVTNQESVAGADGEGQQGGLRDEAVSVAKQLVSLECARVGLQEPEQAQ